MIVRNVETPLSTYARVAGLLYLIIIVCGIYSEVFVRSALIVPGDATATVSNIMGSEGLFKLAFVSDTIMLISDVAIAILFYLLLKPVSQILAMTAAGFRLTQAVILGMNLLHYYAALLLLNGMGYTNTFNPDQLNALAVLFLDIHSHGYDLGLIFFGFSNIILGYLVAKSDYFPGIFGYGLIAAAIVYLVGSFTRFLFPSHLSSVEPLYIIPFIAELAFGLWLLLKGVKSS